MNWREHIESNPSILSGKPVVVGTRLGVEFLLDLFAGGWSEAEMLDSYPQLSPESLRAVFAFGAECIDDESAALLLAERAA